MITIAQAYSQFLEIMPPSDDEIAMCEAWNDYTDGLTKDGELTGLQYHYCPAYGDTMPDDDIQSDIWHILDTMVVTFTCKSIRFRSDGLMPDMDRRWLCGIYRAVIAQSCDMRDMFNAQEIDDLRELFKGDGL